MDDVDAVMRILSGVRLTRCSNVKWERDWGARTNEGCMHWSRYPQVDGQGYICACCARDSWMEPLTQLHHFSAHKFNCNGEKLLGKD